MTPEEILRNVADSIRTVERQGKRAQTVYVHPSALNLLRLAHAHPDPRGQVPWVNEPQCFVFGVNIKTKLSLREDEVEVTIDPVFDQAVVDT